jgi:2TM domain
MSIESRKQRSKDPTDIKNFIPSTPEEARYHEAHLRVKKIKGFYNHLAAYIGVNIMIVILNINNLDQGETYFQFKNFMTAFFWGLGLLAHGLSVFLPELFLGSKWEEKKIQELMEKEKNKKWE